MKGTDEDGAYEVVFSEGALDDAESLKEYLANELGMPDAAHKAMEQIVHAADGLAAFPLRNRTVARGTSGIELRRALAGNYILLYAVRGASVTILAVVYAAGDIAPRFRAAFERLGM